MGTKTANISAAFSGNGIQLSGLGRARITIKLEWRDDPDKYGDAIDNVGFGTGMDSPGSSGSSTTTSLSLPRGYHDLGLTGVIKGPYYLSGTKIGFRDTDGSDYNATIEITNISQKSYTSISGQLYLNGKKTDLTVTAGDKVNVTWGTEGCSNPEEGDYVRIKEGSSIVATTTTGGFDVYPSKGTTTYTLKAYNWIGDETIEKSLKVTAYTAPTATISISPAAVLQNPPGTTTNGVTVSWTSNGSGGGREFLGSFAGGSAPSIISKNGSYTFYPTTAGANFKLKLKVTNGAGKSFTTPNATYDVNDETPSNFDWDASLDNTPLNRTNRESQVVIIKDFGPTQYTSNKLPIKSNFPIQVQIGGDGVWRDVASL